MPIHRLTGRVSIVGWNGGWRARTPFLARIAVAGIVLVLVKGSLIRNCRWLIAFYELDRDDAWSRREVVDLWSFELRINGRERLVIGKGENGKLIAYSKLSFDIFLGRKLVQRFNVTLRLNHYLLLHKIL